MRTTSKSSRFSPLPGNALGGAEVCVTGCRSFENQATPTPYIPMRLNHFQFRFLTRFSGYASDRFKEAFDAKTERRLDAILNTALPTLPPFIFLQEFELTVEQIVQDVIAIFSVTHTQAITLIDNAILGNQLNTLLHELGY
jgi:hypothetical protein